MTQASDVYARHAHFMEQFKNGEVKGFAPFLNRVMKGLRLELSKTMTTTARARINAKLKFAEALVNAEFGQYTDDISGQLQLFAESEAGFAADTLNDIEPKFGATIPSTSQLKTAIIARPFNNRVLREYLNDFSKEQARIIKNAIATGFFEGKSNAEIIRSLSGTKALNFKDGTLNIARTSAERMVRTAITHTASVAKELTYEKNDIKHYEWVSVLDSRTSAICQSRDGKVWAVGKGPLPPAHPNCRSTTSPLFPEDVKILKKGPVKVDTTGKDISYNDWLKKQSKAFQIDALGKTKADLFRKGDLTMDKFVNDAGQALTLDELKTKYPTAWGKI